MPSSHSDSPGPESSSNGCGSGNHDDCPVPDNGIDGLPPLTSDQNCGRCKKDIADEIELRRSGRGIRRLVNLGRTVTQLVTEYDRRILASESDSDDDTGDRDVLSPEKKEEVKRRCDRDYQSYLELIKLIPSLKDKITGPHGSRMLYYAWLTDGANNAQSDDTARVKPNVALLLNTRTNNPTNPVLDLDTRDGRGLQNDFTGRLLCPIKYDWEDLA